MAKLPSRKYAYSHYAQLYNVHYSRIRNLHLAGVDLDNTDELMMKLAQSQIKVNPKTVMKHYAGGGVGPHAEPPEVETGPASASTQTSFTPPSSKNDLARGAAAALDRLAEQETDLYAKMTHCLQENNLIMAEGYRHQWLKVSESLRKYDLAVEQNRRDSGELIPRAEAENAIRSLLIWFRLAFQLFLSSDSKTLAAISDPMQITVKTREKFPEHLKLAIAEGMRATVRIPEYAVKIVEEEWRVIISR